MRHQARRHEALVDLADGAHAPAAREAKQARKHEAGPVLGREGGRFPRRQRAADQVGQESLADLALGQLGGGSLERGRRQGPQGLSVLEERLGREAVEADERETFGGGFFLGHGAGTESEWEGYERDAQRMAHRGGLLG